MASSKDKTKASSLVSGFLRSKARQRALELRTVNEKPMHHDSSASEPLSKKRKMDGGDHASSSSLKMQVEEARERQRKEEEERLEREAAEAEKKQKDEEEEAREREAREAAEREAKLIKLREEKSLSLGPEPEKGPDVTQIQEPRRRGRPSNKNKKPRGRPKKKIVDKPAVEAERAVEPASDGQKRKRGRPPKASKQDFDMAPPCLDSEHYKAKLRSYKMEVFQDPLLGEPTCNSLLLQLKIIWDEVGESYEERGKMLRQIKEECSCVIKRKVEHAAKSKARLLQALADAKFEFSTLLASLGDKSSFNIPEKTKGNIKDKLADIEPALHFLRKQKEERINKFTDVLAQIEVIHGEIAGSKEQSRSVVIDESNLSLEKLKELDNNLQELLKNKSQRLDKVFENLRIVRDICEVLGIDSDCTITDVHPSLTDATGLMSKSISNDTLARLEKAVLDLRKAKEQRLQKLQELAAQLTDLWNLMDMPEDERSLYNHVTCTISDSVDKVTAPGALALALIEQAEVEIERLKTSKMKEIMLKRQSVLDDILGRAHIEYNTKAAITKIMALIDSGSVKPSELLADVDAQIIKAKEEALRRKDILDKVNIWITDCKEENWLEGYNRGDSEQLDLERAEKARILVSKIPELVDTLVSKTQTWEEEHGLSFKYNGAPLLAMLNDYSVTRREREEGKRVSPKPSPACPLSVWTKMDGPRGNMGSNCGQIKRLFVNPVYDTEPG